MKFNTKGKNKKQIKLSTFWSRYFTHIHWMNKSVNSPEILGNRNQKFKWLQVFQVLKEISKENFTKINEKKEDKKCILSQFRRPESEIKEWVPTGDSGRTCSMALLAAGGCLPSPASLHVQLQLFSPGPLPCLSLSPCVYTCFTFCKVINIGFRAHPLIQYDFILT